MSTTKNSNLFYKLYSTSNDVTSSGYVCNSAVDEKDTSFDIDDSAGKITDSNGDELASIDLSGIHADELTLYNTETRILQPNTGYLLQGNENGETYKAQFFTVDTDLQGTSNYASYCNFSFDILYKQKGKVCNVRINTKKQRTTYGSFLEIAQYMLNTLKVPVSISIEEIEDTDSANTTYEYIKFLSNEENYDFVVRNVTLYPILCTDMNDDGTDGNYYDSPFTGPNMDKDWIIDMFDTIQPRLIGDSTPVDTSKINYKYNIDCEVYKEFIDICQFATDDFNTFCYEYDIIKHEFLPLFDKYGNCLDPNALETLREKYPNIYYTYFGADTAISKYNINDIFNLLTYIREYVFSTMNYGPHKLYEDISKRVDSCKYPNGAMRGIVIIPDWSDIDEDDSQVLLVNHVASQIEVMSPVDIKSLRRYFEGDVVSRYKAVLYEKFIATVKVNALIDEEKEEYIEDMNALPLNDITSNDGFVTSFDLYDVAALDEHSFIDNEFHRNGRHLINDDRWSDNKIDYYEPQMYIDDNSEMDDPNIWENNPNKNRTNFVDTHENLKTKVIGLYKYMQYLSDNDLWLRIGDAYMIVGKKDGYGKKYNNLLNSVLIYNPNDVPIRIKYIIFS